MFQILWRWVQNWAHNLSSSCRMDEHRTEGRTRYILSNVVHCIGQTIIRTMFMSEWVHSHLVHLTHFYPSYFNKCYQIRCSVCETLGTNGLMNAEQHQAAGIIRTKPTNVKCSEFAGRLLGSTSTITRSIIINIWRSYTNYTNIHTQINVKKLEGARESAYLRQVNFYRCPLLAKFLWCHVWTVPGMHVKFEVRSFTVSCKTLLPFCSY